MLADLRTGLTGELMDRLIGARSRRRTASYVQPDCTARRPVVARPGSLAPRLAESDAGGHIAPSDAGGNGGLLRRRSRQGQGLRRA